MCSLPPTSACSIRISQTSYLGWRAISISDGRLQAIITPEIGRVLFFGPVDGENLLWTSPGNSDHAAARAGVKNGYVPWGGDIMWMAPQDSWPELAGTAWPPDPAWDTLPHSVCIEPDRIRTVGPVSRAGFRFIREYSFENGEFLIAQTAEQVSGPAQKLSIWNVTRVAPPDLLLAPVRPGSTYTDGVFWFPNSQNHAPVRKLSERLVHVPFVPGKCYKFGTDARTSALGVIRNGVAFVERARWTGTEYPDGIAPAGLPVEVYNGGDTATHFIELELLSPLLEFSPGRSHTHLLRWSMHEVPSGVPTTETLQRMEEILFFEGK